ncbi:glutaredoxin family protein [Piscinibacter sp.]|uniref:glutaredoxin family protein n=1 Tax=Piscinibacter sp. TaxID=1903157 RepID=UPI002ED4AAA8
MAVAVALPAHALYKVVGPDGKVTYTDTPPPASSGSKVMKLGASNNVITEVTMPLEVRQAMQRYPVTLYTTSNCQPCDNGRQLLKQRGIPFNEKLVISGEDGDELLRLSGSRDAPTLTIGAQVMRGFASDAWASYLDSAGYPRESRLPATYQYPTPTPLVAPPAPVAREAAPPQPVTQPQQPAPTEPSPSGIKF